MAILSSRSSCRHSLEGMRLPPERNFGMARPGSPKYRVEAIWERTWLRQSIKAGLANLAIFTARPRGAKEGAKGIALFLVPELNSSGKRNFTVRRLKEK